MVRCGTRLAACCFGETDQTEWQGWSSKFWTWLSYKQLRFFPSSSTSILYHLAFTFSEFSGQALEGLFYLTFFREHSSKMLFLSLCFLVIATLGDCASRQSPPAGALVVAKSGGQYTKVQDAVNALSTTSTTAQSIFIEAGSYNEQVRHSTSTGVTAEALNSFVRCTFLRGRQR